MARIITVYVDYPRTADRQAKAWIPVDMSYIRWFKISEALARCGHQVDMALPDGTEHWPVDPVLMTDSAVGFKPLSSIDWHSYDVVKTLFNRGMETLERYGGGQHRFIICKLGSVVGPRDMPGIYFYGEERAELYAVQERINACARYVTLLSESAKQLWIECHGDRSNILLVPGGVDARIPPKGIDPYPAGDRKRCLFAGLIYTKKAQPEANRTITGKLNELGRLLLEKEIQLYMIGDGDVSALDNRYVNYLGVVPYTETWNYLYHADTGIVVSAGKFMHNNESSKIYHYLRAGLPVVSESGFPNDHLIEDARLGYVTESGDLPQMARKIATAGKQSWANQQTVDFICKQHSWDKRAGIYNDLFKRELGLTA